MVSDQKTLEEQTRGNPRGNRGPGPKSEGPRAERRGGAVLRGTINQRRRADRGEKVLENRAETRMGKLNLQTMAVTPLVIVRNLPRAKGTVTMVSVAENTVKMVAVVANRGEIVVMRDVGTQLAAMPAAGVAEVEDAEGLGTAAGAHTPQEGVHEDHHRQWNAYRRPHRKTLKQTVHTCHPNTSRLYRLTSALSIKNGPMKNSTV